jgi:hypothetical protein
LRYLVIVLVLGPFLGWAETDDYEDDDDDDEMMISR